MAAERVPVLEVGGTHVSVALIDVADWSIVADTLSRRSLDGQASARELLDAFVDAARSLDVDAGARWGVAMPGPFDYERGIALFEDVGKFDSLRGGRRPGGAVRGHLAAAGVGRLPQRRGRVPPRRVAARRGDGYRRCAAVTLGTGVGSGFLADGEIVGSGPGSHPTDARTASPSTACRWRTACPGAPSGRRTGTRRATRRPTSARSPIRARAGDTAARKVIDTAMTLLGATLAPYLQRFGAEVVVIGGSMSASWDLFGPAFSAQLHRPISVAVAEDREHAPLLGAARYALTSSRSECAPVPPDRAAS